MRHVYTFTGREVGHLVASTVVLSAAFAFPLSCSYFLDSPLVGQCGRPGINWSTFLFPALPVAILIVATAFVLHELAHKLVAQRYGHWAEFRASMPGLGIALVLSGVLGVVVAAPGAVLIYGNATKRQAGVISVAGPIVNITFALIAWPLWLMTDQSATFDVGLEAVGNFFQLTMLINVILAAFNMIPVKPLDGSKIVRWNIPVFVVTWVVVLGLGWMLFGGL